MDCNITIHINRMLLRQWRKSFRMESPRRKADIFSTTVGDSRREPGREGGAYERVDIFAKLYDDDRNGNF